MINFVRERIKSIFQNVNHAPVEIATVILESEGTHIKVSFADKILSYRHITSSARGGEWFPDGYFDTHSVSIDDHLEEQIKAQCQKCINTMSFQSNLAPLPPGASPDAYMRYVDAKGTSRYYSNVYLSREGFSVDCTTVPKEFTAFFDLLSSQCFFPEYQPKTAGSEIISPEQQHEDPRYFEETLWRCDNCGTANLFSNRACVKCGKDRGF